MAPLPGVKRLRFVTPRYGEKDTHMDPEDDKDLLSQALADTPPEPPAEPPQTDAPAEPGERPRDEMGRFAPKEAAPEALPTEAAAVPEPAQPEPDQHRIPLREHLEEREKRQRFEREATEYKQRVEYMERLLQSRQQPQQPQQQPQQPTNWFEDPDAAFAAQLAPLRAAAAQEFERTRLMAEANNKLLNINRYGEETVNAAQAEMARLMQSGQELHEYQRIMSSFDTYGELVKWHQNKAALKEFGPDPKAWKEKFQSELLKDQTFLAKAAEAIRAAHGQPSSGQGRPATTISLPPSLSKIPASASPLGDETMFGDDKSELSAALRSRR